MSTEPVANIRLCRFEELPDGEQLDGVGFSADVPHRPGIFVVRDGDGVKAYVNRCPHQGTPLNWTPDRFLDMVRETIVCATHGAVFEIADGRCISGPCLGDFLEPVAAEVRDGEVYVADWQSSS